MTSNLHPNTLAAAGFAVLVGGFLMLNVHAKEPAAAKAPKKATVGKLAPKIELKALDGKTYKLSAYKGKVVVLEWFNPGCPFVVKHHQRNKTMANLYKKYKKKDVVWLAVNSGAKGKQGYDRALNRKKKKQWGIQYPILLDPSGAVGRRYGAKTTPHMYVIDTKGKLAYKGAIDDDSHWRKVGDVNYVEKALDAVLAGKKVAKKTTRAYGCSVKYGKKRVWH